MLDLISERATFPLWQCIAAEALAKLILYQWLNYGTKLEILLTIPFSEIEGLDEIDKMMRQPTRWRRPPK